VEISLNAISVSVLVQIQWLVMTTLKWTCMNPSVYTFLYLYRHALGDCPAQTIALTSYLMVSIRVCMTGPVPLSYHIAPSILKAVLVKYESSVHGVDILDSNSLNLCARAGNSNGAWATTLSATTRGPSMNNGTMLLALDSKAAAIRTKVSSFSGCPNQDIGRTFLFKYTILGSYFFPPTFPTLVRIPPP
jgi:hypothetical protein